MLKWKKKELQEMKKNGRSTLSESKVNFVWYIKLPFGKYLKIK